MKNRFLILTISLFSIFNCFGWGQKGHDVTAYIAEKHLTPTAKAKIEGILGNKSMVYWANWLDNASYTPQYDYTKTWHYKNINEGDDFNSYTNPKGDVVVALNEQIEKLRKGNLSNKDEQLALKIIIHLMGDLHQPMHMGHYSDLGGNKWPVSYFNSNTKLHTIWDTNLVESAHKWSYTEWENQIDRVNSATEKEMTSGTVADWGKETWQLAKKVYSVTPQGAKISYDYIADATPIIENQLLKAGLRLAHVLNSIYNK